MAEAPKKQNKKSILETGYKKIYPIVEKTEHDESLIKCLMALYNNGDVNKDALFFGRAVGQAVEEAVNNIVKQMDRSKVDSKTQKQFVEMFFATMSETLKATKKLHKMRHGD